LLETSILTVITVAGTDFSWKQKTGKNNEPKKEYISDSVPL